MPPRIGFPKNVKKRRLTFIRQWREHRNLTQEALGELVGTSGSMISRIEKSETPYTQDTLEALADALMTDPASLLTRTPPKDGEESIWSIWDSAHPGDQLKIVDIAKTIVGKTSK